MKRALDFTEGSKELTPAKVLCQRELYCDSMASSSSSLPSSYSISSTSQWKYDVFLSFRGADTRNTLVDFLYYALQRRGIDTFKDDEKLEGGKTIKPELSKAIDESRFAVVILSENYASSTWCLEELVKIVDCEKEKRMTVLPIFYHVDPSDVRKLKGAFGKAFDEHEKQFMEKVGRWRDALNHVAGIVGCHHHVKNRPLSEAVKWVLGLLSHISRFEFSQITKDLVGIDSRLVELESCLALKDDIRFIGIWAMGGMGKSTLARVVYKMISKEFEASCFIENVRGRDELSLQEDLISQILHEKVFIKNKYDAGNMIKKIVWNRKVLIVFDDVDELEKLEMLVRKSDRFGLGSRIIITTRDKRLLLDFLVDEIFEVKALDKEAALCLLCSKAFKKEQCPDEYLELSKSILEYVNGLPLALEVLGSFLFEKSTDAWEDALEMLKEDRDSKINQVLKISLGGLPNPVKEIFKDIACFFNHQGKKYVEGMLDCLGRRYKIGLPVLINKSLLKISEYDVLWMHDLVRDMGRNIVYEESPDEPGKRSRLWHYKDIDRVLKNNTGTERVQAIDIKGAKYTSIYHEEKEACWRPQGLAAPLVTLQGWVLSALSWQGLALLVTLWGWVQRTLSWQGFKSSKKPEGLLWNPDAFLKMYNLKFLRVSSISVQLDISRLPNNLSYLEYNDYPLKSLYSLPAGLVGLRLPCSKIELLWGGMKIFENLKSINMDGSSDLIVSPNFNGVQSLEKLVLTRCSNLRQLHPSIGKLKKLKLLDLKGCQELTSLPDKFEMESLVTLNLTHCLKVKKIPEFVGNMEHFQELLLEGTAIIELPSSVECLTGLNTLILKNCKNLLCFPNIICSLTSLKNLILYGCSKIDELPKDLGNIISLKRLDFSRTAIKELPSSIEFLTGLEVLVLEDCKKFVLLPSTVCSLKSLGAMILSRCPNFVNLPENLGDLQNLYELKLEGTAIEVLPSSVGRLAALYSLNLKDCKNLVCLPSTICNLKMVQFLYLTGCSNITNLPENLGNMEHLAVFHLGGTAIKELPSSIIHIKRLGEVYCKGGQLSSSSFSSLPGCNIIDLSDCNLSAIPSGNDFSMTSCSRLYLRGNDFVSLPESSISRFSYLRSLYLDGCKSLRSLSNFRIPSEVEFICVDNCSSLESLPEPPIHFLDNRFSVLGLPAYKFSVQCFNCFKLADNIQNFSNLFQGQSGKQYEKCYIIPGREIPKWFEKAILGDTLVVPPRSGRGMASRYHEVKIELPGSGSGFDEWRGIVLCVVFLPTEPLDPLDSCIAVHGLVGLNVFQYPGSFLKFMSKYGEVELHHLWLHSVSKPHLCLPNTPGCSIELDIVTRGLEVEKVGFCVI